MKGLFFIVLIYVCVLILTLLFKFLKDKFFASSQNNKGEENSSPKIYYIKNYSERKKPKTPKSPTIAIKGTIINKEKSKL